MYIMFFAYRAKQFKLCMYTHSDSFRYAKQRKGGCVHSFGGFTWLPMDKKKASTLSSKNLRNFFVLASCSCQMKLDTCELGCLARDLNLTVFSLAISGGNIPFYFQTTVSVSVITSKEAFNLVEVAILALSK